LLVEVLVRVLHLVLLILVLAFGIGDGSEVALRHPYFPISGGGASFDPPGGTFLVEVEFGTLKGVLVLVQCLRSALWDFTISLEN